MSSIHSYEDKKTPKTSLEKNTSRGSVLQPTRPYRDNRKLIIEDAVFPEPQPIPLTASESSKLIRGRKKKRANISSSFVTPADIFAQNLSDAVMDAEDSDDLESYVYRDTPKYWNVDSDNYYYHPSYYQQLHNPHYSSTDTEGCDSSYIPPYAEKAPSGRRPVLRSMISDAPPSIKEINSKRIGPFYNTFYSHPQIHQSGDVEFAYLHASSKKIERNSNWWTITMTTTSFSVFASSHYVPTSLENMTYFGADPAEFLGTIYNLEDPLIYPSGSLFNSTESIATSQIRIKSPGSTKDDNSGNERWSLLIRYPYELTVRGVLKYQMIPFPLSLSQLHTIRFCKMASVDPATGQISNDTAIPEKSICDDPSPVEGN